MEETKKENTSCLLIVYSILKAKYGPVTTTAFAYIVSTVCVLVAILATRDPTHGGRWRLPVEVYTGLLYAVLLNSVLVYSIISWANKK